MSGELEIAGQVVGGNTAGIQIREKSGGEQIEIGNLLVSDEGENNYLVLKVLDLGYGSQVPQLTTELAAGLELEGYGGDTSFIDAKLRNYTIATIKGVARVSNGIARIPKVLPTFLSSVRYATKDDLKFLAKSYDNPVYLGKIRSGSKVLDIDVYLNGEDLFTHHVLVPATTGRGKSNLIKVMLQSIMNQGKFGVLVLDPHDEYYGRNGTGLKDHANDNKNLLYYSSDAPAGSNTLVINLRALEPDHFDGIVQFTDSQEQAIALYYRDHGEGWIEGIAREDVDVPKGVHPKTISVLRRKLRTSLGISVNNDRLVCENEVFSTISGESTANNIVGALEDGKIVIVDTSRLTDQAELLIGSIIANKIFSRYRQSKGKGTLKEKPAVSIIVEEAPRVLSSEKIDQGENIYSTIAREGRKFKIGLVAITQLTSVIPRMVLTNMNTKIILGNEMATERSAIVDSAAQDLSDEDRTIASLDKGEAIVSSIFTKFAVPIYTPLFDKIPIKKDDSNFKSENLI